MPATLTDLANKYKTDKGTQFGERHGYTEAYDGLFAARRQERIRLLEIGLRHDPYYVDVDHSTSPSLEMWLEYFPRAEIIGLDIEDFSGLRKNRLTIMQGDQGSPGDLRRVAAAVGPLDIVIDDGSHASFHQQLTFVHLFPCLRPGGMYVFEDLHFQPPRLESILPSVPKTRDVFRSPLVLASLAVSFYCDNKLCAVQQRTNSHSQ
jgi:hypothetical protein